MNSKSLIFFKMEFASGPCTGSVSEICSNVEIIHSKFFNTDLMASTRQLRLVSLEWLQIRMATISGHRTV